MKRTITMPNLVQVSDLNNLENDGFGLSKSLENEILSLLAKYLKCKAQMLPEGYCPDGDFRLKDSIIELKVSLTEDIFVEYFNQNKKCASGLSTTKAEYYFFIRNEWSNLYGKRVAKLIAIHTAELNRILSNLTADKIKIVHGKQCFFILQNDRKSGAITDIFLGDFGVFIDVDGQKYIDIDKFNPGPGLTDLINL